MPSKSFLVNELFKIEFVKNVKCNDLFLPIKYRPNKSIEEAIQRAGDISDISTCAENTTATGPGITTAIIGKKATFTIISRDSQNRQRIQGGDVYAVKMKKSANVIFGYNTIKVDVEDQNDGTYLAEYTVYHYYPIYLVGLSCGDYALSVFLGGVHIKGSPFVVRVTRS